MSDTPETDKARADYQRSIWTSKVGVTAEMIPIEFARKLERERDEARKALADLLDAFDKFGYGNPRLTRALIKAKQNQEQNEK